VTGGGGVDFKFILIVGLVGLAAFVLGLVVAARRRGQRDGRMIVQHSPLVPDAPAAPGGQRVAPGSVNLQLGRELERLLTAGKKIEAIKLVRERTGLGLKGSKDAVERLESLMKRPGR